MTNDLISRAALADGLKYHYQPTDQEYETDRQWAIGYNAGLEYALYSIAYAKAVDAVPVVHGEWIEKVGRAKCSVCCDECWADSALEYNFCPNCGAKMDGGKNAAD